MATHLQQISDPYAIENVRSLRYKRQCAGLTVKELSRKTGVSIVSIRKYESGLLPSIRNYNKLACYYGWELLKNLRTKTDVKETQPYSKKERLLRKEAELKHKADERERALTFTFNVGKCYYIYDTVNGNKRSKKYAASFLGVSWDRDCIFVYEGKRGKFQIFREVRGGWTRSYADVQLLGKTIKEVNK